MSTLRTALRIVWGHRLHILIYLVMLSMIGVITGMSVQQPNAAATQIGRASCRERV